MAGFKLETMCSMSRTSAESNSADPSTMTELQKILAGRDQ